MEQKQNQKVITPKNVSIEQKQIMDCEVSPCSEGRRYEQRARLIHTLGIVLNYKRKGSRDSAPQLSVEELMRFLSPSSST